MLRRIAIFTGWSAILVITFATLAPIGDRPHLSHAGPDLERFLAFALLSGALSVAYPKRRGVVLLAATLLAIGLELGQLLQPTRHGEPHDALVKILGAVTGAVLVALIDRLGPALHRSLSRALRRRPVT